MTAMHPGDVSDAGFPITGSPREQLRFALHYAVLAPSSHNSQPWRFVLQEDSVLLCADRTRALPVVDPYDRELVISCGAALLNLRVALSHFRLPYLVSLRRYEAAPDILAEVRLRTDGFVDPALAPLFPALRRRVTNRADYGPDAVPPTVIGAMREAAEAEGSALACIEEEASREAIAELIAQADERQFADSRFRRELASWIHSSRHTDGMPAYAGATRELLDLTTPVVAAVLRTFDVGNGVAASHHRLVQGSPLLACLSTLSDDPESWICAGQAMQRVLLVLADAWFDASFLNQPIEFEAFRERLRELTGSERYPQILLRVGSGRAQPRSPRRPLREVIE